MIWDEGVIEYYLVFQIKGKVVRIQTDRFFNPIKDSDLFKQIQGGRVPAIFWGVEKVTRQQNMPIECQCTCNEIFTLEEFQQVCPKCKSVYRFDGKLIWEGFSDVSGC